MLRNKFILCCVYFQGENAVGVRIFTSESITNSARSRTGKIKFKKIYINKSRQEEIKQEGVNKWGNQQLKKNNNEEINKWRNQ